MHTKNIDEVKKFVEEKAGNANSMVLLATTPDGKIEIHCSGVLLDLALFSLALNNFSYKALLRGE